MSSIVQALSALIGSDAVVAWETVEPSLQYQISQALADRSVQCVVYPHSSEELAAVVDCAQQNRWRMLPCGQGSKLHWGGLGKNIDLVVSTARLNRLIEHASGDLTVTAEAGLTLAALQASLAAAGQFLAIDPAYADRSSLGGIVATGDTGALRQRYGGIRDMLIGVSFVRSDGKLTKAGGRVVKNVAGYDLMKLITGSYGTLGILTQLTFRIYPLPAASATVVLTGEAAAIEKVTAVLLASALTPTAIELVSADWMKRLGLGHASDLGLIVRFQSMAVSVDQQVSQINALGHQAGLKTQTLSETDEAALWRQLPEQIETSPLAAAITCKIGIVASQAVSYLQQLEQVVPGQGIRLARIHAGSGLGEVQLLLESETSIVAGLVTMRQFCQMHGGFLTVLAAPPDLKRQLDPWGDVGSGLPVMQRLKAQFDPHLLLSPQRFVGGI